MEEGGLTSFNTIKHPHQIKQFFQFTEGIFNLKNDQIIPNEIRRNQTQNP
jgi:hypothetical protein